MVITMCRRYSKVFMVILWFVGMIVVHEGFFFSSILNERERVPLDFPPPTSFKPLLSFLLSALLLSHPKYSNCPEGHICVPMVSLFLIGDDDCTEGNTNTKTSKYFSFMTHNSFLFTYFYSPNLHAFILYMYAFFHTNVFALLNPLD